ncbi:MAG: ATP-binding protein [Acidimicrobiaceae bacterium]|nr:ATP-binding protein [Acidimicrobiia bacterium]MCY4494284.1 ATP-binding protein [Acidimicrobiaceae bacterium]
MTPGRDLPAATRRKSPDSAAAYTGEVVLEIPAQMELVSLVRSVVSGAAQLHPCFEPERVEDLRVAVSEATTNAIQSHQGVDSAAQIRLTCNVTEEQIEVTIRDHGKGFDPDALPRLPDPDSPERLLHESGMGLRLMRMLADETEIRPSSSGTSVRLVFCGSKRSRAAVGR